MDGWVPRVRAAPRGVSVSVEPREGWLADVAKACAPVFLAWLLVGRVVYLVFLFSCSFDCRVSVWVRGVILS